MPIIKVRSSSAAEGKMANDEVVCTLVEEVDELTTILRKILNIKVLQAKLFIEKVVEVIRVLEMEGPPTLPDQLVEDIAPLALPIGDFARRTKLQITSPLYDEYRVNIGLGWERMLSREVPELVEQIGLNENKLEKFLDESDFYSSWEDLRHNSALLPCREAVRDLLQSCRELKDAMNFFRELATESAFLCQHLKFLLYFAELCERSNEWRCRQFVNGIMDVANKALDALECADKDSLRSEMWEFKSNVYASKMWENCIEETAKKFFDGKNGKRLVLLETLEMLHSFTEEIDTTCGKLGSEDRQSHNASFGRNGFPSLSVIREKFARGDLPSLPITYYLRAFPLIEGRKRGRVSVRSGIRRPNKQVHYLRAFGGKRRRVSNIILELQMNRIESSFDLIEPSLGLVLSNLNSNSNSMSCQSEYQVQGQTLALIRAHVLERERELVLVLERKLELVQLELELAIKLVQLELELAIKLVQLELELELECQRELELELECQRELMLELECQRQLVLKLKLERQRELVLPQRRLELVLLERQRQLKLEFELVRQRELVLELERELFESERAQASSSAS
ncbi:unnamed protein product [Coffea canephora]|uniref:DH200=94 genomic scaffold, scaffold_3324 n=1 Tax=Coffea canephora TaxID=49390 RepID=A0A068VKH4_COFCA|nr:unnamed protein product [Coffea canephora]